MDRTGNRPARTRVDAATVIALAARWIHSGRRIDMGALGEEIGVSRMTLHRHVGSRERLVGEAVWYLAERGWQACTAAEDARRRPGDPELRSARVIRAFNAGVVGSTGIRTLIDNEPDLALRVLTDPAGPVEPRAVRVAVELIESDERAGRLRPIIDRESLAYALVKLAEAFLYADLVAGRPVAVEAADRVQTALLEAGWVRPGG
ncbi:QsdR family transcriptional regulator [Blastococcus sp. SYSU DS0552]